MSCSPDKHCQFRQSSGWERILTVEVNVGVGAVTVDVLVPFTVVVFVVVVYLDYTHSTL